MGKQLPTTARRAVCEHWQCAQSQGPASSTTSPGSHPSYRHNGELSHALLHFEARWSSSGALYKRAIHWLALGMRAKLPILNLSTCAPRQHGAA